MKNWKKWKKKPGNFDPLHGTKRFSSLNSWGIPDLHPQPENFFDKIPYDLVSYPFGQRFNTKRPVLLHFHTDDYRFESVWSSPYKGIQSIERDQIWAACAPDFSLWADWPVVLQLYNTYRARWVARYWQEKTNVVIIPTVNWALTPSFKFSFLGIPQNQVVNLRVHKHAPKVNFLRGYEMMKKTVKPKIIIWYGHIWRECLEDEILKVHFEDVGHFQTKRQKKAIAWQYK